MIREYLSIWKSIFLSPKTAIPAECRRKAGIKEGILHIVLAGTLYFLAMVFVLVAVGALIVLFASAIIASLNLPDIKLFDLSAFGAFGLAIVLLYIILLYAFIQFFLIFLSFLANGLYYITAKALGGKGDFSRQFYVICAQSSGELIIEKFGGFVLLPFMFIPCIGAIFSLIYTGFALGFFFYSGYLKIKIIQQVHSIDQTRAIICWAVPVVLAVLFIVIIFIAYWTVILGAISSSAARPLPAPTGPF